MSKEQIIDEAYVNYGQKIISEDLWMLVAIGWPSTQEEFINKCKTDTEFSEKWGLKIEERELSLDERVEYYCSQDWVLEHLKDSLRKQNPEQKTSVLYVANTPTKLITITHNDKTIESYE
jgi:hypothetical protein